MIVFLICLLRWLNRVSGTWLSVWLREIIKQQFKHKLITVCPSVLSKRAIASFFAFKRKHVVRVVSPLSLESCGRSQIMIDCQNLWKGLPTYNKAFCSLNLHFYLSSPLTQADSKTTATIFISLPTWQIIDSPAKGTALIINWTQTQHKCRLWWVNNRVNITIYWSRNIKLNISIKLPFSKI